MRRTHRVELFEEGTTSGPADRADRQRDYGDPVVSGVGANVQLDGTGIERGTVREETRDGKAFLDPTDLGEFRPGVGDGLRIVAGDWTSPETFQIVAIPDPGGAHWDVVVEIEQTDEGF